MQRSKNQPDDPAPRTLADLRRALDRKEEQLRELLGRQEQLAAELAALGEELHAMLSGSEVASGRRQSRPARAATAKDNHRGRARRRASKAAGPEESAAKRPREGSLPHVIRSVLERVIGPMKVAEIVEAVKQAGYASTSDNLNVIVSNRLATMADVERIDRGLYQLKRDASAEDGQSQDTSAS